jgi:hypothetical protein
MQDGGSASLVKVTSPDYSMRRAQGRYFPEGKIKRIPKVSEHLESSK